MHFNRTTLQKCVFFLRKIIPRERDTNGYANIFMHCITLSNDADGYLAKREFSE